MSLLGSCRRRLLALVLAAALAAALAGLAGCGGGSGDSGDSALSGSAEDVPAPTAQKAVDRLAVTESYRAGDVDGSPANAMAPRLISTGTVSLRADDVDAARFEVQKVVDRAGGQITDSQTRTGDDGATSTARLVLRVPSEAFDQTVDELEGIGRLETSTTKSEDVTTQIIDTRVRIRVQRASIARIQALLGRARDIRAVIDIEEQLSRRQAALNSLLRQQAYLADQTSLSTITVSVERADGNAPAKEDAAGFLTGLSAGWDALTAFAVGLATVLGALLPWLVLLAVLAVPGWPLLRRLRRSRQLASTSAQP